MSSLPERPDLGHLRKQAKDLLRQYRAHDPLALAILRQHLPAAKDKSDAQLRAMPLGLRDAQSCIARQYGFPSWRELKDYVVRKISAAGGGSTLVDGSRASGAQIPTPTNEEIQQRYEIAQRALEQAKPRTAVLFGPRNFDKHVGYYQFAHRPTTFLHIFREGERFFEQLNTEKRAGIRPVEFYPESETKFFATRVAAQISFVTDAQGEVTELVLHQAGHEKPAKKVDRSVLDAYEGWLDRRIKNNMASPGTEAFLRRHIAAWERGQTNQEELSPGLARLERRQSSLIEDRTRRVGTFEALCFNGVDRRGWDVYEATFARGEVEYRIAPLDRNGKVVGMLARELVRAR